MKKLPKNCKSYLQAQSSKVKRANELNKKISDDIAENKRALLAEDDQLKKILEKPKIHYGDLLVGGIVISFFSLLIFQDIHIKKERHLRYLECSSSDPEDCEILRQVPRAIGGGFYGTESHN